jgi:hypothetical protein
MAQISTKDMKVLASTLELFGDDWTISMHMAQGGWSIDVRNDKGETVYGGTAGSIAAALTEHPAEQQSDDAEELAAQARLDKLHDQAMAEQAAAFAEDEQIEQVLQSIDLSPVAADQGDANDDDEDEKSLGELIEMWQHKNNAWRTEGDPGVENLEKLVQTLGYDGHGFRFGTPIEAFLSDNPGCIEAILNWISEEARVPEWTETMVEVLGGNAEGDDDEDDDR